MKAAVAALYPDVDPATMDVLFAAEADRWNTRTMTADDIRHEIEFMRSGGTVIPGLDQIDATKVVVRP